MLKHRIAPVLLTSATLLCAVTACGDDSRDATNTSEAPSAAQSEGCVSNAAEVVHPAPANSAPLPANLADPLSLATERAFKSAAPPGAVAAVQTPAGTWV